MRKKTFYYTMFIYFDDNTMIAYNGSMEAEKCPEQKSFQYKNADIYYDFEKTENMANTNLRLIGRGMENFNDQYQKCYAPLSFKEAEDAYNSGASVIIVPNGEDTTHVFCEAVDIRSCNYRKFCDLAHGLGKKYHHTDDSLVFFSKQT